MWSSSGRSGASARRKSIITPRLARLGDGLLDHRLGDVHPDHPGAPLMRQAAGEQPGAAPQMQDRRRAAGPGAGPVDQVFAVAIEASPRDRQLHRRPQVALVRLARTQACSSPRSPRPPRRAPRPVRHALRHRVAGVALLAAERPERDLRRRPLPGRASPSTARTAGGCSS